MKHTFEVILMMAAIFAVAIGFASAFAIAMIRPRFLTNPRCPQCRHRAQQHRSLGCLAENERESGIGKDGWLHYENSPCGCRLTEPEVHLNLDSNRRRCRNGDARMPMASAEAHEAAAGKGL